MPCPLMDRLISNTKKPNNLVFIVFKFNCFNNLMIVTTNLETVEVFGFFKSLF